MRVILPIPLQETCKLDKVNQFLDSIQRNSRNSKKIYGIALTHFQVFLNDKYAPATIETILELASSNQVNVYSLVDGFVSCLVSKSLSPNSIALYVAALRSYFAYHDLDLVPSRFKRKVRMPKKYHEDAEPLDAGDIRKILLSCSNRRLKSYLLVLASSGARATEALAIRNKDIDFESSPVRIHIRKEFSKTRVARDIYISDEASNYIQKEWLSWKYTHRRGDRVLTKSPDDTLFSMLNTPNPEKMYTTIVREFGKVLEIAGLAHRKEDGIQRRKIGFHSFRRYVKTVTATQTNTDYSEWLLGHSRSPYWTMKEAQRADIYKKQIMPFLTFLDYQALENTSQGIVAQLEQKDREISYLNAAIKERDQKHETEMKAVNDKLERIDRALNKVQKLEKELGIK